MEDLLTKEEVTVFAPKSSAIKPLMKDIEKLQKQEQEDAIRALLKAHFVRGEVIETKSAAGQSFKSAEGIKITIVGEDEVKSQGVRAKVVDRASAGNGVVYCINGAFGKPRKAINRRRGARRATTEEPAAVTTNAQRRRNRSRTRRSRSRRSMANARVTTTAKVTTTESDTRRRRSNNRRQAPATTKADRRRRR